MFLMFVSMLVTTFVMSDFSGIVLWRVICVHDTIEQELQDNGIV